MGEINTRGGVRSMMPSFPSGNDAECLSKQELLSGSNNLMDVNGGDTECVPMDAIGLKCYPCLSPMDKSPLTVSDIPNMELTSDSLTGNMYLSKYTDDVELTMSYTGGVYGPVKLKLNETVNPGVYGVCTLLGDRIELVGMCNMRWIFENVDPGNMEFQWKINGTVYKFLI